MAATKMQLERLLAVPVPVILSKQALQSKNEFSCGGTHVVKLNAYADLKKLKHVEEVLPDMDMFYASRNDKIFDRCAVVRPTACSNANQDAQPNPPRDDGCADPTGHYVRAGRWAIAGRCWRWSTAWTSTRTTWWCGLIAALRRAMSSS